MTPEELVRERQASLRRRAQQRAAEHRHEAAPRTPMGGTFHVKSRALRRKLRDTEVNDFLPPRDMDVME